MKVEDALYHVVHDYEPGTGALAERMGMQRQSLINMANPNNADAQWPLRRMRQAMTFTNDMRPLHALAAEFGGVFVQLPQVEEEDEALAGMVAELGKDFGEVCSALQTALADKRVTQREYLGLREKVYQLTQAAQTLQAVVEKKAKADPRWVDPDSPVRPLHVPGCRKA